MIVESLFIAIFVVSLGGLGIMLARKAPVLSTLPKNGTTGIEKYGFFNKTEGKVKEFFRFLNDGIVLHRLLSWMKCKAIKMEAWIDSMLSGMRKKAKEKKLNNKK
jgi:hypothetical protein